MPSARATIHAFVSARPDRIAPLVALAARHGCHVVSEKPLALDLDALAELHAVVEAAGVRVAPDDRTLRAFRLTAEALAARDAADTGRTVVIANQGKRPRTT